MVFQRPNPFPTMSIYDNVAAGLKLNGYSNRHVLDEIVEKSLKNSAQMCIRDRVVGGLCPGAAAS